MNVLGAGVLPPAYTIHTLNRGAVKDNKAIFCFMRGMWLSLFIYQMREGSVMIRGVSFEAKPGFSERLLSVLSCFKIEDYNWQIIDENTASTSALDIEGLLSGVELLHYIKTGEYFFIAFNIRAFPQGAKITEPMTYEEFVNSECFLILLYHDCRFVELYCKNTDFSKKAYDQYKNDNEVEEIEFITDDNDARYILYV